MPNPEMSLADQLDVACVLFVSRDLIKIAIHSENQNNNLLATLREPRDDNIAARFIALRNCEDVLKSNFLLQEKLLNVIKSVLTGRSINEITIDDCKIVASRYSEWIHLPLNLGWSGAVYQSRG